MASVEAKLAEALNEIRNQREALEKEVEERRRDHDKLTQMEERMKTLFNRVGTVEDRNREQDGELEAAVEEIQEAFRKRDEKKVAEEKARAEKDAADAAEARHEKNESTLIKVSIWVPVVTAVIGSLAGAIFTVWLTVKFIGHP